MGEHGSITERWLRGARHPFIGVSLAVVGIAILAMSGRGVWSDSRTALASASLWYLVMATGAFAAATVTLAASISYIVGRGRAVWFGAMASQLLKYIPGSLWQAAFLYSDDTFRGVGIYAGVTLFAAAAAVTLSAAAALAIPAVVAMVVLLFLGVRSFGFRRAVVAAVLAIGSVGFVLVSGLLTAAAVGSSLDLGSELAAAWGIGVLAIPVPAGLGVREGVMALLSSADSATVLAVATLYRLVTSVADGVVGAAGLLGRRRTGRSPDQSDATDL